MSDKQNRTLDQLVTDLKEACERLLEVEETERAAVRQSIACRNGVNDLQRVIDERIKKMKEDVPYESKWGQERERNRELARSSS